MTSETDAKYIRITDFDDNGIPDGHEFVTAEVVDPRYELQAGDVLFARSGATVGKTYLYTGDIGAAIFAGYCIRFRFNTTIVLPEFVYFYTKTSRYQIWVKSIQRPSGQPNINKEEFKSFAIPLPPLDIQRALVAEMGDARESRRAKLNQADELLKSLDGRLLAQLGLEPPPNDDRKVFAVRFGDLSERRFDPFYYSPSFAAIDKQLRETSNRIVPLTSQLALPPINGLDARKYEESGQAYLRVQNIRPYEIDASDVRFVNVSHSKEVSLQKGDVLLTRKGTFGISAPVTKEHEQALISSEVILLRLSADAEISTDYLVCWLNSSFAQKLFSRYKTGGIMGHITQDIVKEFPVVVPDVATQQKIIAEMRHLRAEAHRLRAEAEAEWQAAKESFEQQLLTGGMA